MIIYQSQIISHSIFIFNVSLLCKMPSQSICNYNLIEGEWKNFVIKRIEIKDYSKVLEHVRKYFILEEPTCKLMGYNEKFANQLLTIVDGILKHDLSFLAEDKESSELAAVRITCRQRKEDIFNEIIPTEKLERQTDIFLNSLDFTDEQKAELFEKYKLDEYAELFIVATNPKFRKQGLSMELYQRSLKFLKAEGFKLVKCVLTNPTTRRSGSLLGFQEQFKIDYQQMKDRHGKYVFPDLADDQFAMIAIKLL